MSKGTIYIDVTRCLSCKTCEIECAVSHSRSKTIAGARHESNCLPLLSVEFYRGISVPIQCCHCDSAPCISACPSGAITRESKSGAVLIDRELCVGCMSCGLVCPYGVPEQKGDGGTVIKCDLCTDRLVKGSLPACVDSCPTKAIKFIEIK